MAAIVAKLKLRQILRKMLPADMDMRAVDPALERRPKAFKAVHGRAAGADVFARAVVDRHVAMAAQPKAAVALEFVGMDLPAGKDVRVDRGLERGSANVFDNLRNHVAVALHYAENDRLTRCAPPALAALADAADIGFVNFNDGAETANRKAAVNNGHILADFVAHPPSRFVGHADLALDFLGGDPVPRSAELEHDKEPIAQACASAVERGSGGRIDLCAAMLASVGAAGFDAVELGTLPALFAVVTVAETDPHKVIEAAFLGGETVLELAKGGGFRAHADYLAQTLTCRKGIMPIARNEWARSRVIRRACQSSGKIFCITPGMI